MERVYMNIEYGNILETKEEVMAEAKDLYDFGDPTNPISIWEYYKVIFI